MCNVEEGLGTRLGLLRCAFPYVEKHEKAWRQGYPPKASKASYSLVAFKQLYLIKERERQLLMYLLIKE